MSDIDLAIEKARELDPDLYDMADHIARVIDPGAFTEWYDGTGPDARLVPPTTRMKYMRADAERKAFEILKYLDLAPATYDWERLFRAMYPSTEPEPSP